MRKLSLIIILGLLSGCEQFLNTTKNENQQIQNNKLIQNKNKQYSAEELELQKKATQLTREKKYDEAFPLLKELADKGYKREQTLVGGWYERGIGTEVNLDKAEEYLLLAANQNEATAQFVLGGLYYNKYRNNIDRERNLSKALSYIEKSAENNNVNAQYMLGSIYYYGYEIPKDLDKAKFWLEKASNNGDEEAKILLKKLN